MRSMTRAALAAMLAVTPMAAAQAADTFDASGRITDTDSYMDYDAASTVLTPVSLSYAGALTGNAYALTGNDYVKAASDIGGAAAGIYAGPFVHTTGGASWAHDLTPNGSGLLTFNAYVDLNIQLADPIGYTARHDAVDLNDPALTPDPWVMGTTLFRQSAMGTFTLRLEDLTDNTQSYAFLYLTFSRTIALVQHMDGTWAFNPDQGVVGQRNLGSYDANGFNNDIQTGLPGDGQHFADFLSFQHQVDATHQYRLSMDLSCAADLGAKLMAIDGVSASCDGAHSGYWSGITGAPPGFTLLTGNGQNFALPSALSPALPGVPEPAVWAMLLIGFGAVGGAMRRAPKAVRR